MNELTDWQESNARYLSLALDWLRARLERRAGEVQGPLTLCPPRPAPLHELQGRSLLDRLLGRASARPIADAPSLLLAERAKDTKDNVEETAAALGTVGSQMEHPPALQLLGQRLGLSQFEQHVLLLCAAMELDTGIPALCARAQGDPGRPYPTFALALTLFDEPAWDVLSPERPLRYWRLIEINQPAGQPLTASPLRLDERLVNYLKGLNYLDDRLSPLLAPLELTGAGTDLPPSLARTLETVVSELKRAPAGQNLPVVQLLGTDAASKQLIAVSAANALRLRIYQIPAALLPSQAAELETLARLWQRESLLLPVALYLDALGSEIDAPQAGHSLPVNRFLARTGGMVFLDTREVWPGLAQGSVTVDVVKPTSAEQHAAWTTALGEAGGDAPALLTGQFDLGLTHIQQIARQVLAQPADDRSPVHDRLWNACLARTRPRLDTLAQRIDPKATWDDIVLPAAENKVLHDIAAQVRQRNTVYQSWGFADKMSRGLGISALFAGDAGTGKTMAAEVIANELRLNLYRIDLSAVVSKYIGETEKNLRRLFDAAEDGGAILFFDEADALFGKRSEVKDSHDRYANIEVNYLLQRMEAYRGLAILATNMRSALDPAFMRRLRFVVNFIVPGVAERKLIWQKVFPPQTPTSGLDFERVARLNLTGGNIHSIALNAAFRASETGTPITMPLIFDTARAELRKLGRVINELEFREAESSGRAASGRAV